MYAACQMRTDRLVTRKVGEIEFRVPVPLGYVCNIYARTKKEGNTSLTVTVTVTRKTFDGTGSEDVVCETDIVFVALDQNGKPTPWTKTPPKKRRSKKGTPSVSPDQLNIFDTNDPRADYLTHKRALTTEDRNGYPIPPTCGQGGQNCKGSP